VNLKRPADITRFLKAPGAVRAALIHGPDHGVVRERAQALAEAVAVRPDDPFETSVLSDTDLADGGGRLEEALAAYSLTGGRRLVRLRLADERRAAEALSALEAHLAGSLNPDAFFLIEAGALRTASPLRRAAEKSEMAAAIACYSDEIGDLARLTREALAAQKTYLTPEALEVFVSRLPHERGVARQEIERLALYIGPGEGRTAGAADLEAFLGVEPEASLADAALDAFGGRLAAAWAGLRRAAQEGEGGPAAVRAMSLHAYRLRRAAVAAEAGTPWSDVAREMRIFWKMEREFIRQARTWSLAEIDRAQADLLAADQACKQTGSPDQLIAQRLALSVAGRARRLGL
jgi:DNA polymerase-3 subunit delta